jgi:membrane-associated PAP2 superfamily phosphatase
MLEKTNRQIALTLLLIVLSLLFFQFTSADIWIEDFFYNAQTHSWFLSKHEAFWKFVLYDGIKKVLLLLGVAILLTLLFLRKKPLVQEYQKGLMIVLLAGILVPAFIGSLKAVTNTPCPCDLKIYNGKYPDVKVLESYPEDFVQKSKIKCWPAGHASGGFALMAFFFFFKTQKNRNRALFFGLVTGWSMGTYKMIIGDHFFSHTFMTMLFAWLIILIIAKFFKINSLLVDIR